MFKNSELVLYQVFQEQVNVGTRNLLDSVLTCHRWVVCLAQLSMKWSLSVSVCGNQHRRKRIKINLVCEDLCFVKVIWFLNAIKVG